MKRTAWQMFEAREKERMMLRRKKIHLIVPADKNEIRERKKQYLKIARLFHACGMLSERLANRI